MELYFVHPEHISSAEAEFDSFETQHLLKSMRKKIGDMIYFTDGTGHLFKGEITAIKPTLKVTHRFIRAEKHTIRQLAIGIGFIRHNRMDFAVEKATELGVNSIYLIRSRYSNYYTANSQRWEKIARQAIKQSQRLFLPHIQLIPNFNTFLEKVSVFPNKYLLDQNSNETFNDSEYNKKQDMVCLIGPEGGFDTEEISLAQKSGFQTVSLGRYRLRSETAAVATLSIMSLNRN
jgi:16S rRNA (uracil1498-N3)-methyltransferase